MSAQTKGRLRGSGSGSGWSAFLRERFQLPVLLVLGTAQAASAQYVVASRLDLGGLLIAIVGIVSLLALMRLMDELKDLEKDRVAHPERPLPRGTLSEEDARRGLHWAVLGLVVATGVIAVGRNLMTGALYGLCVAYTLLMYREFFAPRFLGARPFTYAVTHQLVLVPMYLFATAAALPELTLTPPVLWYGLTGLGASFAFEVCRKLDPEAHAVLGTYLAAYGPHRTVLAVTAAVVLAAYAAYAIAVHVFVWPVAALLLTTLSVVYLRPERYKWVEGAASLFALVQVLAPTLAHVRRILG